MFLLISRQKGGGWGGATRTFNTENKTHKTRLFQFLLKGGWGGWQTFPFDAKNKNKNLR